MLTLSAPTAPAGDRAVGVLDAVRLAAFPVAYGLTGALVGGTLNRVLIADVGVSATLVAIAFAIPLLVAPARVWFGHRSDSHALGGPRRVPYLLVGAGTLAAGVLAVVGATVRGSGSAPVTALLLGLSLLVYGIGRALAHNSFQALVTDRFGDRARGRAMTAYEVTTMLGVVAGAGVLGRALERFDPARLVVVGLGVAVAVLVLTVVAAIGQERARASGRAPAAPASDAPASDAPAPNAPVRHRSGDLRAAGEPAPNAPAPNALGPKAPAPNALAPAAHAPERWGPVVRELVVADPQVRRFFVVVMLVFLGTLAQDVVLEPFAAQVLGLSVGDTTRLTAFWGMGVLGAMLLSAAVLLPRLGRGRLLRLGIGVSVVAFGALIVVAVGGDGAVLRPVVAGHGIGTGLAGAGMLAHVVAFTTARRAGLLLGVWAVANMLGHALGSILGGIVVDLVRALTGQARPAYVAVFVLELLALVVAAVLLRGVDVSRSRAAGEARQEAALPVG